MVSLAMRKLALACLLLGGCAISHGIDDGVIRSCSPAELFEAIPGDGGVVGRLRVEAACDFDPCEISFSAGPSLVRCVVIECAAGHPMLSSATCADAGR